MFRSNIFASFTPASIYTTINCQFKLLKCRLSKNKATKEDIWYIMWEVEAKLKMYSWHQSFVHFPFDWSKMIKCKERTTELYLRHAFRMHLPAQVMISLDAKGWEVGKCVTKWVNVRSSSDCSCLHFPACLTNLLLFACCSLCTAHTCLEMSSFLAGMNIVSSSKYQFPKCPWAFT